MNPNQRQDNFKYDFDHKRNGGEQGYTPNESFKQNVNHSYNQSGQRDQHFEQFGQNQGTFPHYQQYNSNYNGYNNFRGNFRGSFPHQNKGRKLMQQSIVISDDQIQQTLEFKDICLRKACVKAMKKGIFPHSKPNCPYNQNFQ